MAGHPDALAEAAAIALWADSTLRPWVELDEVDRDHHRRRVRIVLRIFRDAHRARATRDGRTPTYLDRHVQRVLLDALA